MKSLDQLRTEISEMRLVEVKLVIRTLLNYLVTKLCMQLQVLQTLHVATATNGIIKLSLSAGP